MLTDRGLRVELERTLLKVFHLERERNAKKKESKALAGRLRVCEGERDKALRVAKEANGKCVELERLVSAVTFRQAERDRECCQLRADLRAARGGRSSEKKSSTAARRTAAQHVGLTEKLAKELEAERRSGQRLRNELVAAAEAQREQGVECDVLRQRIALVAVGGQTGRLVAAEVALITERVRAELEAVHAGELEELRAVLDETVAELEESTVALALVAKHSADDTTEMEMQEEEERRRT